MGAVQKGSKKIVAGDKPTWRAPDRAEILLSCWVANLTPKEEIQALVMILLQFSLLAKANNLPAKHAIKGIRYFRGSDLALRISRAHLENKNPNTAKALHTQLALQNIGQEKLVKCFN